MGFPLRSFERGKMVRGKRQDVAYSIGSFCKRLNKFDVENHSGNFL